MIGRQQWHAPQSEWIRITPWDVNVHTRVWRCRGEKASELPVVLVAGLGVSSRYWVPLGRRLAERFDVLAPDLPGFGRTPKPPTARWPAGPDAREQAEQLLAWMDACGIARAFVCGQSLGSQTATYLATRHPDRVERLILAAPTFDPAFRGFFRQFVRLLAGALFEAPSLVPVLAIEYGGAGPARIAEQALRNIPNRIECQLPKVPVPTLVVAGRHDPLVSQRWAQTVARLLPTGRLVTIDRIGHAMHFSAAHVTAPVFQRFLTGELDAAPPGEIVPAVDQASDPHAPPQLISARTHALLDSVTAGLSLVLPHLFRWSLRARCVLTVAGLASIVQSLFTEHERGAKRKIPMIAHVQLDVLSGLTLLTLAGTLLRRERAVARRSVAAVGLFQLISALLTNKLAGPAKLGAAPATHPAVDRQRNGKSPNCPESSAPAHRQ